MTTNIYSSEIRTRLYQLAALGFSHPSPELHRLLVAGDYQFALGQCVAGTVAQSANLSVLAEDFSGFECRYINLFQVGNRGRPQVSLNAADYPSLIDGDNRPEFLLRYSSWYRYFGLKITDGEGANELPDHLVCQLEFVTWLSHLETIHADTAGADDYARAQRDFLQRHLRPFLEALQSKLRAEKSDQLVNFYVVLCALVLASCERVLEEFDGRLPSGEARPADDGLIETVNLWG